MKKKRKLLYTLASLLIVLSLVIPVWSTAVSADTPTEIWDWHGLNAIRDNLGGSYVLMNDLDSTTPGYEELAGLTANEGKGWEPIGYGYYDEDHWEWVVVESFVGSFDGQGYEIRGLFINRPDEGYVGLFGHVAADGVIEDAGVVDADVTGEYGVGAPVGWNSGTVSNSYATGSVSGANGVGGLVGGNSGAVSNSYATGSVTGDLDVGGLAGVNNGTVSNSYATGSVTGHQWLGGLVGWNSAGTVSRSYATGSVSGVNGVGGLVGWNTAGTVSRSYATGSVTGSTEYVGGLMGSNLSGGTVSNSFWDTETSGTGECHGGTGKTTEEMQDIATFTDTDTEGLDDPWHMIDVEFGTTNPAYTWNIVDGQTYPFLSWEASGQIRDWYDLHAVRDNLSGSYVLMNDLDSTTAGYAELAGPTANEGKGWQPIGAIGNPFTGSLDGQGYEVRDLFIDRPAEDDTGLFGYVGLGGTVGRIGLVGADVTGNLRVGGLVGLNRGTVRTSHSGGTVTGNDRIGGLVGDNGSDGTVSNCQSSGSVNGNNYVGGLVGMNWSTVSNSHSSASVTGNDRIGGLVGDNGSDGTVSNCQSSGSVTGNLYVGGLVGWNEGDASGSYSDGSVQGSHTVGGLVGSNRGSVSDCYATGTVTRLSGTIGILGGFVGSNYQGSIVNCYSTGSVHYQDPYDDPTDKGFAGSVDKGGDYEITDCFWDTETSVQISSACGDATGKTTVEMKDIDTFSDAGWEIVAVAPGATNHAHTWNIIFTQTYPFLSWQPPIGKPAALIGRQTREVNCTALSGVTVTAYLDTDFVASTVSNDLGNYALVVSLLGVYEVVATKDGFRDETRWINVEDLEQEYELNFRSDHGLIPDDPDLFYVLECIDLWLYPPGDECGLTLFRVLDVIDAWLYPVENG